MVQRQYVRASIRSCTAMKRQTDCHPQQKQVLKLIAGRKAVLGYCDADEAVGEHALAWDGTRAIDCDKGEIVRLDQDNSSHRLYLNAFTRPAAGTNSGMNPATNTGENASASVRRPWRMAPNLELVVNDYSNEAVRCAFDVHTSSLIVYDFRTDVPHMVSEYSKLAGVGKSVAFPHVSPLSISILKREQPQTVSVPEIAAWNSTAQERGASSSKSTSRSSAANSRD